MRIRLRAVGAAVLLLLCGCRGGTRLGPFGGASVVLVSIDTLRADHLPAYGYQGGRTPTLDRLAKEGILFEDVFSDCPLTLPAHASLLTGLTPPHHGVRDNVGFTLKPAHKTLATRFSEAGLDTGGAISAYVLRSQTGISQGFGTYDDALELKASDALDLLRRDGGVATESLSRFVASRAGKRFFAFLHLYEPHAPYTPPERYRDLPSPYDGQIAYSDELLGRLVAALKEAGVYDTAIVAVTSDHGEGLMDHGEAEHGIFLYTEAVHVPLILRLPGGARGGERVRGVVSQADIAPTLLDLAGVPPSGMDGQTLRGTILKGSAEPRPAYSETLYPRYHFGWSELYAVTEARYRFIRAPREELYDRAKDPGERSNVAGAHPDASASMNDWLQRQVDTSRVDQAEPVSPDVREKLQALGYVGSGGEASPHEARPDPKDQIGLYEELRTAYRLRAQGQQVEAVDVLRGLTAKNPRMLDAWQALAYTLTDLNRIPEAEAALEKAVALDPGRAETNLALAKAYALQGQYVLATRHAEIASAKDPGGAFEVLGELMMDKGKLDAAADFARKSLAADPDHAMSQYILGIVAQRAGRYEEALGAFRKAEAANRRRTASVIRDLHYNTGDCLARLGRNAEAEQEFLAEIKTIPRTSTGRVGLAILYRSEGRDEEARAALSGLVTGQKQPTADEYWTVVHTFSILGDTPAAASFNARARALFPSDPRFR
jgi:arylsulfatase A-like enzyme/Tfp pilus assembly protein PilF